MFTKIVKNSCIKNLTCSTPWQVLQTRKQGSDCKKDASTKEKLLTSISCPKESSSNKVTVVGIGQVGMACAFSILTQNVSNDLVLVDQAADRLKGERMDLEQGSQFMNNAKITSSTDYAVTAGSKICVITAGARQKEGESRLALVQRNTDIIKTIVPQLIEHSPKTILLLVSNPVDILTYVALKVSCLPKHKVMGTGTALDSARYKYFLAQKLGIAATSCHAWIIGEHGDSSVPVWSGVNVAGVNLRKLNPKMGKKGDPEKWNKIHKEVVQSAYDVIKLKGYTSWAIGLSTASVCKAIFSNSGQIVPVSINVKGYHCIEDTVCLSLPVVLGQNGVTDVVKQNLAKEELAALHKSVKIMKKVQKGLKF